MIVQGTIVYVLASDEKDYYLEQLTLSLLSLRNKKHSAKIAIATDPNTFKTLVDYRASIKTLADYVKIIDVPDDLRDNKALCSRWIKTSIRKHFAGPLLVIDTDTLIINEINEIWGNDKRIGCVSDMHRKIKDEWNSGVMLVPDTCESCQFYEEWNKEWIDNARHGIYQDQPSMWKVSEKMKGAIVELEAKWNYQISTGIVPPADVKIVHYFSYDLDKSFWKDLFENISGSSVNSIELQGMIFKILSYRQSSVDVATENVFLTISGYLYLQAPKFFGFIDRLAGFLYRIYRLKNRIME